MSKAPWKKDPFTGLSLRTLAYSDFVDVSNPRSELERDYPDCDIWNVRSMSAIVGKSAAYMVDRMLSHPDRIFHTHQIRIEGLCRPTTLYGTHTTSLQAAAKVWDALPHGLHKAAFRSSSRSTVGDRVPRSL